MQRAGIFLIDHLHTVAGMILVCSMTVRLDDRKENLKSANYLKESVLSLYDALPVRIEKWKKQETTSTPSWRAETCSTFQLDRALWIYGWF